MTVKEFWKSVNIW